MRLRITAVAASVVALSLVAGALVFYSVLRQSLESNVQNLTHQDATSIATQIDAIEFEVLQEMIDQAQAAEAALENSRDDDDDPKPTQTPTTAPDPDPDGDGDGEGESDGVSDDDSDREGDDRDRDRGDGFTVNELNFRTSDLSQGASAQQAAVAAQSSDASLTADRNTRGAPKPLTAAQHAASPSLAAPSSTPLSTDSLNTDSPSAGSPSAGSPSAGSLDTGPLDTGPLSAGSPPRGSQSAVPPGGGTIDFETLLDRGEDRFVQLLSPNGEVLVSSDIPEDAQNFVTARADTQESAGSTGQLTVLAGRSTAEMRETLATVGGLLSFSVPLLVLIVAVTAWFVVGRSLQPVERMRRELDAVTASDLGRRVADPGNSDEISRLAHTMNGMLERLEDAQVAQRRFISDASHELKSPLASLRQYAEVAQAHPESIGAEELTVAVLDEGARLEHLVQGMLVLARADEHALPVHRGEVDLDDLVFAEAQRLRELGRLATPPLRVDSSAVAPVRVHGDGGLLRQLVRNLADNASRHAQSVIRFELRESRSRRGTEVLLVVADDGNGVPREDRERIFQRFVRLDDARTRGSGGSGLGLAIVAEIAAAHGATVRVGDAHAGTSGAVFELRMPRHPQQQEDADSATPTR